MRPQEGSGLCRKFMIPCRTCHSDSQIRKYVHGSLDSAMCSHICCWPYQGSTKPTWSNWLVLMFENNRLIPGFAGTMEHVTSVIREPADELPTSVIPPNKATPFSQTDSCLLQLINNLHTLLAQCEVSSRFQQIKKASQTRQLGYRRFLGTTKEVPSDTRNIRTQLRHSVSSH